MLILFLMAAGTCKEGSEPLLSLPPFSSLLERRDLWCGAPSGVACNMLRWICSDCVKLNFLPGAIAGAASVGVRRMAAEMESLPSGCCVTERCSAARPSAAAEAACEATLNTAEPVLIKGSSAVFGVVVNELGGGVTLIEESCDGRREYVADAGVVG